MASSGSKFHEFKAMELEPLPVQISSSRYTLFSNNFSLDRCIIKNFLGPYLDQYTPCLWTEEQLEMKKNEIEVKAENQIAFTEIKFKLNPDNFLEYTLKDLSGKLVTTFNKINPTTELNAVLQAPLTQVQLDELWPSLWKIISSRGQVRYDMEEANKLAATLDSAYQVLKVSLTEHLLQLVLWGRKDEVEDMIKINPRLLLESNRDQPPGPIMDLAGRSHEGSAYQLALGADDTNINHANEGMVEMLEFYLKKLPNGESERLKQKAEQFPEGFEEIEKKRNAEDMLALNRVITAVAAVGEDKPYEHKDYDDAINPFRNYLADQAKTVIKSGYHFNDNLLQKAYHVYDEKFKSFSTPDNDWESPRNLRCWRQIIGTIHRYLTACLAQVHAQGLYHIMSSKEPLKRTFEFRFGGNVIFPVDSDLAFRLGYDHASTATGTIQPFPIHSLPLTLPHRVFEAYVEQKKGRSKRVYEKGFVKKYICVQDQGEEAFQAYQNSF